MSIRTRIALILTSVVAIVGALIVPADASQPLQMRDASSVYHSNAGNDQAFSIMCMTGHGPFWVLKTQSAYQKCLYGSRQAFSIDVPNNFSVTCLAVGSGISFSSAGTNPPYAMPAGNYNCYTNHN